MTYDTTIRTTQGTSDAQFIIEQRQGVLREIAALKELVRAKEQQAASLAKQAGLTHPREPVKL